MHPPNAMISTYQPRLSPVNPFCSQSLSSCGHSPVAAAPELLIQLNFDSLAPFEQVRDQYRALGVRFAGAIALQPSNPVFSKNPHALVLMPTAGQSFFSIDFCQPVQHACTIVAGVRRVTLTAFNADQQPIMQQTCDNARYLKKLDDLIVPLTQQRLEVMGESIARVTLESDSPFVMVHFLYG